MQGKPTTKPIHSPSLALTFMLAGNSRFTLASQASGKRFTYRVAQSERDPSVHFVSVMTGSDNEADYRYAGIIRDRASFQLTRNSKFDSNDPPIRAFDWTFKHLLTGRLPSALQFWHEGRCGRCNRVLTVPESIASGFGPECITHLHEHLQLVL